MCLFVSNTQHMMCSIWNSVRWQHVVFYRPGVAHNAVSLRFECALSCESNLASLSFLSSWSKPEGFLLVVDPLLWLTTHHAILLLLLLLLGLVNNWNGRSHRGQGPRFRISFPVWISWRHHCCKQVADWSNQLEKTLFLSLSPWWNPCFGILVCFLRSEMLE